MRQNKNSILPNGTGNIAHPDSGASLIGSGLVSQTGGQQLYGQYNDYTGDSSTDMVQIGSGKNHNDRNNALRVTKDGEVILNGGGEVYMRSPDTGEIVPVYMVGSNNRLKKVHMSR